MSKHTPGPWEVGASGTDIYYPVTPDSWVYVASASSRGSSDDDEANAKLIAAAPDMAEALQAVREILDRDNYISGMAIVDAALAKAGL